MKRYLFAEWEHPMPTVGPIEVLSDEHLDGQLRTLHALGARTTVLDAEERERYAELTRSLIEAHPDLAV